jgi:RNA polymerase sigma factor (sigma-70 family)
MASVPEDDERRLATPDEGPDDWLDVALQRLPWKQRAAVTLAYYEDLPVRDIALALGCSVSAVKTHLSRGRQALRKAAETHVATGIDPGQTLPRSSDGHR